MSVSTCYDMAAIIKSKLTYAVRRQLLVVNVRCNTAIGMNDIINHQSENYHEFQEPLIGLDD